MVTFTSLPISFSAPDFEPGLNEAFPGLDQPAKTLSVKQVSVIELGAYSRKRKLSTAVPGLNGFRPI